MLTLCKTPLRAALLLCLLGARAAAAPPGNETVPEAVPAPDAVLPPGPAPPPPEAGFGGLASLWDPRTSPFIPIPEIGTDPNSGTTVGILPVFLTSNDKGEITRIVAPDVIYNPVLGYGADFRVLDYPSQDAQWSIVGGADEHIQRGLDAMYTDGLLRQDDWSRTFHFLYDRNATDRFFGFGNNSRYSAQSNYTLEQASMEVAYGWNVNPDLQIAIASRPRLLRIEQGVFANLPATQAAFPNVPGYGATRDVLNRLFIAYDTRDSTIIPTRGGEVLVFAGMSERWLLSSTSYALYGTDIKEFIPLTPRVTFAGHIDAQYMPVGNDTPFWALSQLGGDRSIPSEQGLLRGFGQGRFVDRNMFSATAELRTKVFSVDLFSTSLTVEAAPFVDVGRVFHNAADIPIEGLHKVLGLGFRGIASPFIVGYVDIGYGSEGPAIFSGINYPF